MADGRFSRLPAAAVYDRRLTNRDLRVLAAFAVYVDREGIFFPGVGTVAGRLGVRRQAVQRQLRRLIQFGYIIAQPQTRPSGGRGTNLYQLKYPPLDGATEPADDPEAEGRQLG